MPVFNLSVLKVGAESVIRVYAGSVLLSGEISLSLNIDGLNVTIDGLPISF